MPKKQIDYQKSVIYKIVCKNLNIPELYIGSTTDLTKRKYQHKSSCKNEFGKHYNTHIYKFIRENEGWDNWDMILVEEYPCENKNQLHARERYWIEQLKATLNKSIPTRTHEEWIKEHPKEVSIMRKKYRENHKEEIAVKNKEYNEEHKEERAIKQKKYDEEHKEEIAARKKKYYEEHKEERKKKYQEARKEKLNIKKNKEIENADNA